MTSKDFLLFLIVVVGRIDKERKKQKSSLLGNPRFYSLDSH
jgi:hypothetical protein